MRSLLSHSSLALVGALAVLSANPSTAQAPAPAAKVVYIHAGTLLDRPGTAPRGATTLIVRDGRIEAVRDGFVAPEAGARLVDLSQQFVLPGLIDMHVHIFNDDNKMRARLEQNNRDVEDTMLLGIDNARRTLEAGFTTLRDLGSDVRSVTALRDGINSGLVAGPTLYVAGRSISITAGHGDGSNNTNRDITEAVHARATNVLQWTGGLSPGRARADLTGRRCDQVRRDRWRQQQYRRRPESTDVC